MFHKIARGFSFHHMSVENRHRHRDIVTTLRFAFSAGITKSMGRLCLSKGKFLQVELSIFRWKLHDGHGSSKIKNLHKNTQIFWSQDQKPNSKKNKYTDTKSQLQYVMSTKHLDRPLCYNQPSVWKEAVASFTSIWHLSRIAAAPQLQAQL